MKQINLFGLRWAAVMGGAALWFCLGPALPAQLAKPMSMEELVTKSDHIFTAKCKERKSTYRDGQIVTTYKLEPDEVWKGGPKRNPAGQIEFEELGGELEGEIPIGRYIPGMADIGAGEEVLLFARDPQPVSNARAAARPAPLKNDTIRITGFNQGRFGIIRNPESGEKLVTRVRQGNMPDAAENISLRKALARADAPPQTAAGDRATPEQRERTLSRSERQDHQKKLARYLQEAQAKNRQTVQQLAGKDPKAGEEIIEFDDLQAVRQRVTQLMKK